MKRFLVFLILVLISIVGLLADTEPNNNIGEAEVIPDNNAWNVTVTGTAGDVGGDDWYSYTVISGDNIRVTINSGTVAVAVWDGSPAGVVMTLTHDGTTTDTYIADQTTNYVQISAVGSTAYSVLIENLTHNTLPVELSSFSASVTTANFVSLSWVTASESNLLGYSVLRSKDSNIAKAVKINASVISATNTSSQSNYNFVDEEVEQGTSYNYWLQSLELDGTSNFHGPVNVQIEAPGDNNGDVPPPVFATAFKGACPNPFNPSTSFNYTLAEASQVSFDIYNLRGKKVKTINAGYKSAGEHTDITWNGIDSNGNTVASGVYFIKMSTKNSILIQKALLLK